MKKALLLIALVCATLVANAFTMDDIQNWTGTGSNRSALVLQWPGDNAPKALVFGYKWDGEATGADMAQAIADNNPRLQMNGSQSSYGLYITGFKWDANNNGSFDDAEDYTSEGWSTSGYWSYWLGASFDATWSYAPVGCGSRKLADGSVDGWAFGTGSGFTWKELEAAPAKTATGVIDAVAEKAVAGVKYYNLQGVESAEPFTGVNIVVTTYTDGSHSTAKVVK